MARRNIQLAPFLGLHTSLDSRFVPDQYATDMRNVRIENGALTVRYGYRNISAAPGTWTALYGLEYLQGYSGSTEVDEFVSIEERTPGTVKPYSINFSTGTRTEITNGGAAVNLHASTWRAFSWQDVSYFYNPNEPTSSIYKHTIGTNNSFKKLTLPTAPTAAPTYAVTLPPYSTRGFTGVSQTVDVAYTGAAVSGAASGTSINPDGSITVGHTASNITSSFEITLNGASGPGLQDWYYNDIFSFTLRSGNTVFKIDPASVRVTVTNDSGTAFTPIKPEISTIQTGQQLLGVRCEFNNKTRSQWGDGAGTGKIRKIKVEYVVTATVGSGPNNRLTMTPWTVGGVRAEMPGLREPGVPGLRIRYTYYDSTNGFESGFSPELTIPRGPLQGQAPIAGFDGLGVHLRFTFVTSGEASVDNYRLYVWDSRNEKWKRVSTVSDAGTTYDYKLAYPEVYSLTEHTFGGFKLDNVSCATPYKGCVVWGYKQGNQNIRFSRVGEPEKQHQDPVDLNDLNRAATFSLADNYADEPIAMFQAGDALIILGKYGAYAMVGDMPATMTPPKKLPGSVGCANAFAACRWKDDRGNPGVAFLSAHGDEVWFAQVDSSFDGENGFRLTPLTFAVRPTSRSFLLDGQSALSLTDFSTARMGVDDAQDALWLIMGKRAMVLRKQGLDGQRQWELYEYTTGSGGSANATISRLAFSTKRRMVWARSTGELDEVEFNSSTRAYITGATRDGGLAMPSSSIYWESKTFTGQNTRAGHVLVERDTLTNTPTITATSQRQTSSITLASGKEKGKFGALQQGQRHKFKIAMTEGDDPIRRVVITLDGPLNDRWLG